jgi:CubicO group peptidase (beta-lactamase class C family)
MRDRDRLPQIPRDHLPFHLPLWMKLGSVLGKLMRTVTTEQGNKPCAPGVVFMVRRDGQPFVSLGYGWARIPMPPATTPVPPVDIALPMTEETVVQIASMAKPFCAAAVVALMDDWNEMRDGLANLPPPPTPAPPATIDPSVVPPLLRPLFDDPRYAARIDSASMQRIPDAWRPWVQAAADRERAHPFVPWRSDPFQGGLLLSVLRLGAPLTGDTKVIDLMKRRLRAESDAGGEVLGDVNNLPTTLRELLMHRSGLREETELDGASQQPPEGYAVYPLWDRVILLLSDGPTDGLTSGHPRNYTNSNYSILGAMIEAVTEQRYTDWLRYRVIRDLARFPSIDRRAAPQALAARYYGEDVGTGDPAALRGTSFGDYTNWSADGGCYVTAAQFTDWMYALYAGLQLSDGKPLVSAAGHALLFGPEAWFVGGNLLHGPSAAGTLYDGFEHNGGAGTSAGTCSGIMKIFTPQAAAGMQGGPVYTACLLANGPVVAENLFYPLFNALMEELP